MEKTYVLYAHRNPITNAIFYIGMGNHLRPYTFRGRNIFWKKYVNKYGEPIVEILKKGLSITEVKEAEIAEIAKYGRRGLDVSGVLVNRTLGGESGHGLVHSEAYRKQLSLRQTGRKLTQGAKDKISKANSGKKMPEAHKQRLIALSIGRAPANKGQKASVDKLIKMSEGRKGKHTGENHHMYGKKLTEERKQHLRDINKGKKASEATKIKLSIFQSTRRREGTLILDTITGIYYDSIREAARSLDINHQTFYARIHSSRGNQTSCKYV